MLSAADWARMAADLAEVRGDNETSITIRRGTSTVAAQKVRIARAPSQGLRVDGMGTKASMGRAVVMGATTLDIQPGDRFTDAAGALYQVVLVRPNRRAAVVAEAEMVE